jgi:hypothetical protein
LTTPDNPKSNKKAVCLSCIRKHTLSITITNPECFVSNKAILCCNHLKKCENFASEYNESEKQEILSRKVAEDEKKDKNKEKLDMETKHGARNRNYPKLFRFRIYRNLTLGFAFIFRIPNPDPKLIYRNAPETFFIIIYLILAKFYYNIIIYYNN